jgi:diguanylate cyclase (GGDEF)-like protein/PAS domain S-box-containing protein
LDGKRILIVGDTPGDAELAERELRRAGIVFTAKHVDSRDSFVAALKDFDPDIVLSDCTLRDFDGLSAVKIVRQRRADLPVIVVTKALGDEAAVELIKAGAKDYVLKGQLSRLAFAVQRALSEAEEARRRREADQALKQSEEKFRKLVETAGDWIWETDGNGVYTYASPRVKELLGFEPDELVGKSRFDLMPAAEARRFAAVLADIRERRKAFSLLEITNIRKDGREIMLQTSAVPIFDGETFKGYRGIDRDITQQKMAEREIAVLAHTDTLTGLANRASFLAHLKQDFARAHRSRTPFAVLYLDLDHFKDVNDTLGHPVGDTVLRAVADRLRKTVRETDLVARFGGDEFAILQSDVLDASDAGTLASKICASMADAFLVDGNEMHLTASIGISLYHGELDSPDAMLGQADLALYRAKDEGRNRYCFHSQGLDDEVHERVTLAEDLLVALERNQLELYYQPQVAQPDGRIVGLEALIRWHHPRRGLLFPASFIAVAERRGIMNALGRWVLNSACHQIAAWRDADVAVPVVAINLSATQFRVSSEFETDIASALKRWDILPESIELEIAESILMETTKLHGIEIERVRLLGVRFVVDDFGTGYSSLGNLLAYRFTRLKIAPRFVGGANADSVNAAIVRAAIGLARELGIDVIAEGVETKEQLAFLVAAGCMVAQGYYFCPPVRAFRAGELLRQMRIIPAVAGSSAAGHDVATVAGS